MIPLKDLLQGLAPGNIQVSDIEKTVIQEISPEDSTVQEVHQIAEIVQAGASDNLVTMTSTDQSEHQNVRYLFLTQGPDGLQQATEFPSTFLIEGVPNIQGQITTLTNEELSQAILGNTQQVVVADTSGDHGNFLADNNSHSPDVTVVEGVADVTVTEGAMDDQCQAENTTETEIVQSNFIPHTETPTGVE